MKYTLHDIASIVAGKLAGNLFSKHLPVQSLCIDSRTVIQPEGVLFFALKTSTGNGHSYIPELYKKQVRLFVVEDLPETGNFPEAVFVVVENTLNSLQRLASFHRKKFQKPLLGITGSNGKTIVKEWLYLLLQKNYIIIRSPGSYNSQIGVPLSIWNLHEKADLAIIEAGVGQQGDMERLAEIIQPNIGIFTNIGDAHSAGFNSLREKTREKLLLFQQSEVLFYNSDNNILKQEVADWATANSIGNERLFEIGTSGSAVLRITKLDSNEAGTYIEAKYKGRQLSLQAPFSTPVLVENLITCWAVMLYLGYEMKEIRQGASLLSTLPMRLEMIHGIQNSTIINDVYNADKESLQAALNVLSEQHQHSKKTVILGSLEDSSVSKTDLHHWLLENLLLTGVGRLLYIGKDELPEIDNQSIEIQQFRSTKALLGALPKLSFSNEAILIKGARMHRLEKLVSYFQLYYHRTVLEINLDDLAWNIRQFREITGASTKMMAMVKAFSYGSGSYEIARILEKHKVDYLAVAYTDEGIALRKAGISMPIMVMNSDFSACKSLYDYKLEPVVFSTATLQQVLHFAVTEGIEKFPVHLEIDTGMHRLGLEEEEIDNILQLIGSRQLEVKSVFTHLAASEDQAMDDFTNLQLQQYNKLSGKIAGSLPYKVLRHALNSSGILRFHNARYDMVRLGIGMYGVASAEEGAGRLEEVSTLKTTISQIRVVQKGETVGYNRKGKVDSVKHIATVNIGYADGYPLSLGEGRGYMLVNGKKAPVIGKVCMDMTMIDITGIDHVKEGGEVIVFGKQLSVATIAALAKTIPYEILTGIASRVKRVYFHR